MNLYRITNDDSEWLAWAESAEAALALVPEGWWKHPFAIYDPYNYLETRYSDVKVEQVDLSKPVLLSAHIGSMHSWM